MEVLQNASKSFMDHLLADNTRQAQHNVGGHWRSKDLSQVNNSKCPIAMAWASSKHTMWRGPMMERGNKWEVQMSCMRWVPGELGLQHSTPERAAAIQGSLSGSACGLPDAPL